MHPLAFTPCLLCQDLTKLAEKSKIRIITDAVNGDKFAPYVQLCRASGGRLHHDTILNRPSLMHISPLPLFVQTKPKSAQQVGVVSGS